MARRQPGKNIAPRPSSYAGRKQEIPDHILREEVQRLRKWHLEYELEARPDTGEAIRDIEVFHKQDEDAVPALHLRWQDEGVIHNLRPSECEALGRAGFRISHDDVGYWIFWRKKRPQHLWLACPELTWSISRATKWKSIKWQPVANLANPALPLFEKYPISPEALVRESLTKVVLVLQYEELVPEFMFVPKFFEEVKNLADDLVEYLHHNPDTLNDLLEHLDEVPEKGQKPNEAA